MSTATATRPDPETSSATMTDDKPSATGAVTLLTGEDDHVPETTVIEATHTFWPLVDFGELWRHREMLFSLTMREIMRRYKQTALGVVWAILPVFANTVLVSLVFIPLFRNLDNIQGFSVPLFIFTGLLPWYLFANIMHSSAHSVTDHSDLITRIYFPRLILPLSCIGDRLLDFAIGFAFLCLGQLLFFVEKPGYAMPIVLVVVLGLVMAAVGVGLIMAAAGVAYRDVFHALGLLTQFWFFATPSIFYPKTIIPAEVQPWLPLNPAFGLIENFRFAMTSKPIDYASLGISLGVSFVLLLIGLIYFQRAQRNFSDVI